MLKVQLVLVIIAVQLYAINCYTLHHIQRPFWPESEGELSDEQLFARLLRSDSMLNEPNVQMSAAAALFDQTGEEHSHAVQKRGRQCLWKVCSWALDKRSLRPSASASSNSVDALSKLLY